MLLSKVKDTIAKYSLLVPGDRVVVAVSGGPDSVCLLAVLHALKPEFDLSLHVAHLDHMFRGKESAAEARFVADLAEKLGLPATVEQIDVSAYCRERGLSAQAGAREVRYAFLLRVAAAAGAVRIATGHTTNDQAETFLLRLIRGAGLAGLSAIPPRRDTVIRPLIETTRDEILDYLQENNLSWVTDSSNVKPVYARNRVRSELLPVLLRFNPGIVRTLANEAALLRDEDDAAESLLEAQAGPVITREGETIRLDRSRFLPLPRALARRALRKAVSLAGVDASDLSLVQVDEAVSFIRSTQTGRAMHLPQGLVLEREYDFFLLRADAAPVQYAYPIAVPGLTVLVDPPLEVAAEICRTDACARNEEDQLPENNFWQARFDYDKIAPVLTVRNRRPGDWFCPAGMQGRRKKLQDFFVDEKVPRSRRDLVPLLVSGDEIVWVAGFRTDHRFLPGSGTGRVLNITIRSGARTR